MAKSPKKKKKKQKKKILSAEEKQKLAIQRAQLRDARAIFKLLEFRRIISAGAKEFTYEGTTSDFDDIFVFENVLTLVEYTTSKESSVSDHLKKKKVLYDKILSDPQAFIEFIDLEWPDFKKERGDYFSIDQFKVIIIYCSLYNVKPGLKQEVPGPRYLDYPILQYFKAVTRAVRASAQFEFFKFLGLDHKDIGENIVSPTAGTSSIYEGSVLPENHSHFGKGYKVVSFYVDPEVSIEPLLCSSQRSLGRKEHPISTDDLEIENRIDSKVSF